MEGGREGEMGKQTDEQMEREEGRGRRGSKLEQEERGRRTKKVRGLGKENDGVVGVVRKVCL